MKVRATILCENSVGIPVGVVGEHGFACYLETENGNYLFDTGQGFGLIQNAMTLGKDLKAIDGVMISHGHYDHTGGLPALLKINDGIKVYGHPEIFIRRTAVHNGKTFDVGIPFRRCFLEGWGADFHLNTGLTEVGPGVYLTGEVPRKNVFEKCDANMTAYPDDGPQRKPDLILDDQSLIVESEKGLIVILGCAHSGMINILDFVLESMQKDRIYAVIGGTHLGFSSENQMKATLDAIDRYGIQKIGVSHCTGLENAARLYAHLPGKFFFGCVGSVLEG